MAQYGRLRTARWHQMHCLLTKAYYKRAETARLMVLFPTPTMERFVYRDTLRLPVQC